MTMTTKKQQEVEGRPETEGRREAEGRLMIMTTKKQPEIEGRREAEGQSFSNPNTSAHLKQKLTDMQINLSVTSIMSAILKEKKKSCSVQMASCLKKTNKVVTTRLKSIVETVQFFSLRNQLKTAQDKTGFSPGQLRNHVRNSMIAAGEPLIYRYVLKVSFLTWKLMHVQRRTKLNVQIVEQTIS